MKQFFRKNYALVAGVLLPLALIAAFFLAGKASVVTVADPQYDVVFAHNYFPNSGGSPYRIGIDDGKLYIRAQPAKDNTPPLHQTEPVIYLFDHKTLYAHRIDIDFKNVVDGKVADPELDALNRARIDPNPTSPDGYRFERDPSGGGGLFAGLFGWRYERGDAVLRKGVRAVRVVGPEPYYSTHFIGWVTK